MDEFRDTQELRTSTLNFSPRS